MACRLLVKKAAASFMKKISAPYRGYVTGTMACGMWAASPISSPYRGYTTTGTVCGLWKKAPSSAPYRGYTTTGTACGLWKKAPSILYEDLRSLERLQYRDDDGMVAVGGGGCFLYEDLRSLQRPHYRLTVDGSFKIRHHAHARVLGLPLDEKIFFSFSCDLDVQYADIHKWANIHFKTHGNLLTITITDHRGDVLWITEVDISEEEEEEEEAKH